MNQEDPRYISNLEHPLFVRYRRDWLHEKTGFSKGYLSRVSTGKTPLSRAFVERVCFSLQMPESELFLPDLVIPSNEAASEAEVK